MSTVKIQQNYKRNFILILVANAILGSAMPMLIVLGGLAGISLTPHPGLATLPPSSQMLAGLFAAAPISILMEKRGRKFGFLVSGLLALFGGLIGGIAMFFEQFLLLIVAHAALGAALVGFGYFRFAASEVVPEQNQSVAVSLILGTGLISALLGPEIFNRTKDLTKLVPYAGAYLAIIPIAIVGLLPVILTKFANTSNEKSRDKKTIRILEVLKRPPVAIAVLSASISGGVMVLLMTPTPLAMTHHGHSEIEASSVIKWHVIAMFAPSFITGWIIKRFGVINVIAAGMILLLGASLVALSGISLHHFYAALIILGVGWNFGFIGGTTLLAQNLKTHERGRIQGFNDTALALSISIASFSSGALVTTYSWLAVANAAFPMLAIMLFAIIWHYRAK